MAIRQIRLPEPAGTPRVVLTETPAPTTPQPNPKQPTAGDPPPPRRPEASPAPAPAAPVAPAPSPASEADPRVWYRAEPWLAVELAAAVPVLAALVSPQEYRVWLVALAALLVAAGLAMLAVRHR